MHIPTSPTTYIDVLPFEDALTEALKPHPDYELADWVLSNFKKDEIPALRQAADNACDAAELIINGDTDRAMNNYNS